jgi:hypothetical protein
MTSQETNIFVDTDGTKRVITGYSKPQVMTFKDPSGVEHRIFMDLGTHERAYQLYMDENWEELKKFPIYGTDSLQFLQFLLSFLLSLAAGQTHAKMDTDNAGRDNAGRDNAK